MTTLRSFQHEIDEIHSREIAKQRGLHDKENKPAASATKGKVKDEETGTTGSEHAELQEVEEGIIVRSVPSTVITLCSLHINEGSAPF